MWEDWVHREDHKLWRTWGNLWENYIYLYHGKMPQTNTGIWVSITSPKNGLNKSLSYLIINFNKLKKKSFNWQTFNWQYVTLTLWLKRNLVSCETQLRKSMNKSIHALSIYGLSSYCSIAALTSCHMFWINCRKTTYISLEGRPHWTTARVQSS